METIRSHRIKKGLDLPITGAPVQEISDHQPVGSVAFLADDFPGLRSRVVVTVGEQVKRGQPIVEDRDLPGVHHTAPGAGKITAIHRGARRSLQSVVIALSKTERADRPAAEDFADFASFTGMNPADVSVEDVRALLLESGLWTSFRTRPFGKTPPPASKGDAIFVTATDTNPLAPSPPIVLSSQRAPFELGLCVISRLTAGKTYLCVQPDSEIGAEIDAPVTVAPFAGPHPAGTVGVHIHLLEPVSRNRTVWHIGYQDVVAVGNLFLTGRLDTRRVISIAGPPVKRPRLIPTRVGAAVVDLVRDEVSEDGIRWISGSVFSGKAAIGEAFAYLGRFDIQLSALREGGTRKFMGWIRPGRDIFSTIPLYTSSARRRDFAFTTDMHGAPRAMVPIGLYERVMPFDILPTLLLRALAVGDTEQAERLGCLELAEEDVALCTFVDSGKVEYGPLLRSALEAIQREG